MHSEIVPPQGRLRASIAAGIVIAALCFVVAALEHTVERMTEEERALRLELAGFRAMPPCLSTLSPGALGAAYGYTLTSDGVSGVAPSGFRYSGAVTSDTASIMVDQQGRLIATTPRAAQPIAR